MTVCNQYTTFAIVTRYKGSTLTASECLQDIPRIPTFIGYLTSPRLIAG